jgi:hypothetical protein
MAILAADMIFLLQGAEGIGAWPFRQVRWKMYYGCEYNGEGLSFLKPTRLPG